MALSTGSLLAGRYEITAPVAVGGMGEVWQARDRVLGRIVAAKVLKSEFTGDPNFLARFRNEARHTAALSHPNIASVYDYGETLDEYGRTVAYLVMEFVEGQPLVTILHEEGRLPVDWTMHVLEQAADGLSAAHQAGVVHRDIKPGNLIVRPDGVVKLTDFGIAQARDAAPLTRTGMVVGTAQYLSPEQAQGLELNAASDVYSLGVVGYECLTGVRPFDGTSQVAIALAHINRPPPPLPAEIPLPVADLIARALAKDPTQRFADGGAMADAVHRVIAGETPGTGAGGAATGAVAAAGAATEVISAVDPTGTQVLAGGATGGYSAAASAAGAPGTGAHRARPMPPLQAPPDDDEPAPAYYDDDRPASRRRVPWLIGALVLLVALAGVGYLLFSRSSGNGGTAARSSAASTSSSAATAATVPIDTRSLVGQDAATVTRQLTQAGLVVSQRDATAAELRAAGRALRAGTVAGTTHAGETVPKGTAVVLFVSRTAFTPGATTTAATTTAAPSSAPTTAATRTTTSAPTDTATTTIAPTTTKTVPVPPPPQPGSSLTATSATNAAGESSAQAGGRSDATAAAANGATQ